MKLKWIGLMALWGLCLRSVVGQELLVIHSANLPKADTVWVFLPKNRQPDRLPALILLHGYGGNYKQFSLGFDLAHWADSLQMAIVCPDGLYDSWYFDSPNRNWRYEKFFFEELLPKLSAGFAIDPSRLAIDGFSMGGHGAIYLAGKHPERFVAAGSFCGTLDLEFSGLRNSSLKSHLGAYNRNKWYPYMAISRIRALQKMPLIVSCGLSDPLLKANRRFKEMAQAQALLLQYSEGPGGHTMSFVRTQVQSHLTFFRNEFDKRKKKQP